MKLGLLLLALGFAATVMVRAAERARPQEDVNRVTIAVTNSTQAEKAIPQLVPNSNLGPEVPLVEERQPVAASRREPAPPAARRRNPLWVIVAVLAVLLARHFLRGWFSKSDST